LTTFFYNIFLLFYKTGIGIAALWNKKAARWVKGRKEIFARLTSEIQIKNSSLIWVHCSSLGEFEQGRPVIDKLKLWFPDSKILLTFFSPSGFEIRKNYKGVDWVFYLPMDSAANAKRFFDIVQPKMVIFIKYDYWYYYLTECKKREIPLYIVSAIFRNDQPFFKWYGSLHRRMLKCFSHIFVQDKISSTLLNAVGIKNVTISGDTRFDRVVEIAGTFKPLNEIERFCGPSQVLVAGSTWPPDERLIKEAIADFPDLKIIIAPHEIHDQHLDQLKEIFPGCVLYSQFTIAPSPSNVLIIDNIGMLSRLYHYATVTYIGGGFDKGIHNTLEAAVFGKPVLFGPHFKKFKEAVGLIEAGGGASVNSANELKNHLRSLLTDKTKWEETGKRSLDLVMRNKGATEKIMQVIQENRRFTN
jgi:3-deoxy-D-manno-octulosonic-acid transferase